MMKVTLKRYFSIAICFMLIFTIITPYEAEAVAGYYIYPEDEFDELWEIAMEHQNITVNAEESINDDDVILNLECIKGNQKETYFSVDKEYGWNNGENTISLTVTKSEEGYIELNGIRTLSPEGNPSSEKIYIYVVIREGNGNANGQGTGQHKKRIYEYNLSDLAMEKLDSKEDEVIQNRDITILEVQPNHSFELTEELFSSYEPSYNIDLVQMSMPEFISKVEDINGRYDVVYVGNKLENGLGYYAKGELYPSNKNLPQGDKNGIEYYSGNDITNRRAKKLIDFIESGQLIVFDKEIFENQGLRDTKLYKNFYNYIDNSNIKLVENINDYFSYSKSISDGNGLKGEYFDISWWGMDDYPKFSRTDANINFDWGTDSPNEDKLGNDGFAVIWTGKVRPRYSEKYRFYTSTDDGVRLWIKKNNHYQSLINKWKNQSETEWHSGKVKLEAGQLYDIEMHYYEDGGNAVAKLSWSSPSQSKEIIPSDRLYLPSYNEDNGNIDNDDETILPSFIEDYSALNKRPMLNLNIKPKEYSGEEDSYETEKMISYGFDAYNTNSEGNMTAKLYLDIDGDGIFTDDEIVKTVSNIGSGEGYSINHRVPDYFTGLHPWKLELIDDATGAKVYEEGAAAFRGEPLKVRVLQLYPGGNTLSLSSLKNKNGMNLLEKEGEYEIEIIQMPIKQFNDNYPNPYNGNPTLLNGNYDMIILGFADVYGNGDLTRDEAINAVKEFIETDQSVMFTHDTMTFYMNNTNGWSYHLTKEFRDIIGQNIYLHEDKPSQSKPSYGFSNLTLDRARNSQFFTTNKAHKLNSGQITKYPFVLGDIDVAWTHFQYFQLDLEDDELVPWYTLTGDSRLNQYDGRNNYYTYTKGNITYSGTGHSKPDSLDEQKLFVNTMIKASKGANHAPTLEIYGIEDGQNFIPSEDTISFFIKAEDADVKDSNLTANIYINDKLVKTFEFEKGKQIPVLISKAIGEDIEEFTLKVVVSDSSNAEASETINLTHLSIPTLNLKTTAKKGYLIGDTIDLGFEINSEDETKNEYIDNISLETNIASDIFNVTDSLKWSKNGNVYSTTPTLEDNNRKLSFKALKTGEYSIDSTLSYSALGEDAELGHNTLIDVKSGSLDIQIVDNKNRGKENVDVYITKPDGSVISGTTNETGLCIINGLASGIYVVTIDIPDGYSNSINDTKTITLSYDYNAQEAKFVLEGNPVTSVTRNLPETLNISQSYEINYSVDGDMVVYNEDLEVLEFKGFEYDETFPAGVEIIEYPEGLTKTGSLETGYRLHGNVDGINMLKVDSENNLYKVDGDFSITIRCDTIGEYTFNQGKVNYKDPFAIEGEIIVNGGTVEVIDNIAPAKPIITAAPTERTNGDVTVVITAEEGRIEYRLGDSDEWLEYTGELTISENTIVYAKAIDLAGNESEISQLVIDYIDKSIIDVRFISGENREDSVFRIGRLTSKFRFRTTTDAERFEFKIELESDEISDFSSIQFLSLGGKITLADSEESVNADVVINPEEKTIVVTPTEGSLLEAGEYNIEFPVEVNFVNEVEEKTFYINIVEFKVGEEDFTKLSSPENLNKINIIIIELPRLL